MDLLERLRPKWRHPDAQVRRAALRKLDDVAALEQAAATDPEPALRELAAERLLDVLQAAAMGDGARPDCEAALARLDDPQRLAAVASQAAHAEVRAAALARVDGDRLLRDVVRTAADPATRHAALERIADPDALRSVAVGDVPAELAVRAVERIGDPDTLRALAAHPNAAKAVRQRARALLPADEAAAVAADSKDARARQLELCVLVQGLRAERDVTAAATRVRAAREEWGALARVTEPRAEVAQQFVAAAEAILADAALLERRLAEVDHLAHEIEANLAARTALCVEVEALDGAAASRRLGDARTAWQRLAPLPDGRGAHLAERFAAAARACEERRRRWEEAEATRSTAEELVAEAEAAADASPLPSAKAWRALERRWRVLVDARAGDDLTVLRDRFTAAGVRLGSRRLERAQQQDEAQRANLTRLQALVARMDELTGAEALKPATARRALQTADEALADLGPLPPSESRAAWTDRLAGARTALLKRLAQEEETEEWRRWANAQAQEEIIARVEAVLEANDLVEGTKLLGQLQPQWDAVATASADKSQALWERFRTARNELRRRCDVFLAENLEKKRALVAQAAALGDSMAWNETADALKKLQAEWKAIGPVPVKLAQAVWQEFRAPCDGFFARRQEHFAKVDAERSEHAKAKIALCEQAEALADSTDWDATIDAFKRLQAEWKRGGAPPRAQADALWKRFRAACDRFFDRHRRRGELAREAEVEKAEGIVHGLEAVVAALGAEGAPADADVGAQVDAAWGEWLRCDAALLGDTRSLDERLRLACEQVMAARPGALAGTRLDPATTRERREKLCARLEALAPAAGDGPKASLQEMAMALRERLAANTMASGKGTLPANRRSAPEDVERIVAGWARLGPVLGDEARALAERFERALSTARRRS